MTVNLALLVEQLKGEVPARNQIPSDQQYTTAIADAVLDYSNRVPIRKQVELAIVAGTANYTLPTDFAAYISLDIFLDQDGILNTPAGLIALPLDFSEEISIAGRTLTISPTPTYSTSRTLRYRAFYELDQNSDYDLTPQQAAVIRLKAQAICLNLQANAAAQEAWSYKLGDESVDKKGVYEALKKQAEAVEKQYRAALQSGPVDMMRRSNYAKYRRSRPNDF